VRQLVPAGAVADAVVGLLGDDLVLCTTTGTRVGPANQGRAPLGWWDLSSVAERTVLCSGPAAVDAYETAQREWRILVAAALVGMGDGALSIAVEHAKDRIAFGVPIGSFQAVAHPLADVAIEVETVRRLVWKAAWWADADPTAMRHLIPMAYLAACETAVHSATVGVHTLGGVGFTVESDEQLYFRRATGWALIAGDPLDELDRIADALYGADGIPAAH
jgi:alkylation response protein AidB-like acyl-CoA dehydrogenase